MSEYAGIDEELQGVKDRLAQMRRQLETLSSTIWRDIDHENPARLEEGVRFKQRYNELRGLLESAIEQMLALLQAYPPSGPGAAEPQGAIEQPLANEATEAAAAPPGSPEPIAASPADARLEHKVPFGFVLGGQTYTSASAWPLFYEALLQELYGRAPEKLSSLADAPGAFQREGKPLFARVPDPLDDPLPIADSIFAEADLAPASMIEVIKPLIRHMGYSLEAFKILLKEKNRGTVETLSLAA